MIMMGWSKMTLWDLINKSGMHEVFPTSSAEEAFAKSVSIRVRCDGEPVSIYGTDRIGDDITLYTE
jgi:hypothetical protein